MSTFWQFWVAFDGPNIAVYSWFGDLNFENVVP